MESPRAVCWGSDHYVKTRLTTYCMNVLWYKKKKKTITINNIHKLQNWRDQNVLTTKYSNITRHNRKSDRLIRYKPSKSM